MTVNSLGIDWSSVVRALKATKLAEAKAQKYSIQEEKRRAIFLVDVQGIYLSLITWMGKNDIPLEGGELIGNLAASLMYEAVESVRQRDFVDFAPGGVDYRTFVDWVINDDDHKVSLTRKIDLWSFEVELFYAPSPIGKAKSDLNREIKRKGRTNLLSNLEYHLERGLVSVHGQWRDYTYYDDFVRVLKKCLEAKRSGEGFFNFRITQDGLKYFDEKEVDIRIAVRAMDIMQGEADAICIVSSDQDFMPLHQRCRDAGLRTYHADVAQFDRHNMIGRRIKELGEDAIFVEMPKSISDHLLSLYVSQPQLIDLTRAEYKALCDLYENVNGNKFGQKGMVFSDTGEPASDAI